MELAGISTSVPVKNISDITECPLCNEVYNDPRVLPCLHTFCFECIDKWVEYQVTGGKLACPLCRKEVLSPSSVMANGIEEIADLPKNSFVQKVIDAKKRSNALSGSDMCCDVCCDDSDSGEKETTSTKKAVAYCVECCQNICEQCCKYHHKMKTLSAHRLVNLQEDHSLHSELLRKLPEDMCDKHADRSIMLYCDDCKLPTCIRCVAENHELHKFSDVKKLADEMRVQMRADIEIITTKVDEYRQLLSELENNNPDFDKKIEASAELVTETAEKMKQAIDNYKVQLLDELESSRKQHKKKVESVRLELEANTLMLEMFKHYSEQVESEGTASDVVTSATSLHLRTNELIGLKVCVSFSEECVRDMKFSSELSCDKLRRMFGEMCFKDAPATAHQSTDMNLSHSAELLHVINSRNNLPVSGVTSLDDDIYVVCHNTDYIDVYDAGTFKLQRSLSTGFYKAVQSSITACNRNKCIYMSTLIPSLICRIDPSIMGDNVTKHWPTAKAPSGISVNRDANLLVTCREARKIQEFTTNGMLVREILLQSDVTFPMYAVQLTGDQFGVTHAGSLHRFCVVGSDGCVIRSFGGQPGSDNRHLRVPQGLARNESGDQVFIADVENCRVLCLDAATLNVARPCIDAVRIGIFGTDRHSTLIKYPGGVHYDQSRGRLYIGERGAQCRVIVYAV